MSKLHKALNTIANQQKQREHECAEIAINNFINEEFYFGKATFVEFKWIDSMTVRVKDYKGNVAKIRYDFDSNRVLLN